MGKRTSQKKSAAVLDNDAYSLSSYASSACFDNTIEVGIQEVQMDKDTLLDQCLDALFEKRGSTREKALALVIDTFNSSLEHDFLENKFATLLQRCLNSIKKGSVKEVALASHTIGLLAITTGPGDNSHVIFEDSISLISEALRAPPVETSKMSALLECLAIVTFVGCEEPEQTEKSMQIMWQVACPKLGTNVEAAKRSPALTTVALSAWCFLLTTVDGRELNPKAWQESINYLSTLLDKDDRLLRIAAGEALAVIYEKGSLEKFCGVEEANESRRLMYMNGLRNKVINQVHALSTEGGGKGCAKKDLNTQRNTFRNIMDFLEDGYTRETWMKINGESLSTSSWAELIRLKFLKHFLGGGFDKHMQENEFLHHVFAFSPNRDHSGKKKSKCTVKKARTQLLEKQRSISQDKNAGWFAVGLVDC